jgi:putative hydrolase of the HAD superfamily
VIFFDIDGTLLDDRKAIDSGLDVLHTRFTAALGLSRDELTARWRELLDRQFPRFLRGEISMQEQRRERMRALIGDQGVEQLDAAFEVYLGGYQRGWTPFPDVTEVLSGLSEPLGVITNGNREQQAAKLAHTGLASLFSVVVISEEFGVAKPDRRIFEEACRRAAVPVTDAVHVGDDWDKDVAGSHAAGLRPIWLRRGAPSPGGLSERVCVIDTLYELPAALTSVGLDR